MYDDASMWMDHNIQMQIIIFSGSTTKVFMIYLQFPNCPPKIWEGTWVSQWFISNFHDLSPISKLPKYGFRKVWKVHKGTLGSSLMVSVLSLRIEGTFTVESPADTETIKQLKDAVDAHCPVKDMLQAVPMEITLNHVQK